MQSLHVGLHKELVLEMLVVVLDVDCFHLNLVHHDVGYLLDCFPDVKDYEILREVFLLLVEDRIVQDVVHEIVYKLGG